MFGNKTILQNIVETMLHQYCNNPHALSSDGYQISDENKLLINNCLSEHPQQLFMKDIPKYPNDEEDLSRPVFSYAIKSIRSGYGWCADFYYKSQTSVMAYLIELGGGIGCKYQLLNFNLTCIQPQLFIGASDYFLTGHKDQINDHIINYMDFMRLYKANKISEEDVGRLNNQAVYAIKHGNVGDDIKSELILFRRMLQVFDLFDDKLIMTYAACNVELLMTFLQLMHQFVELNIPVEMTQLILCHLTGLELIEIGLMQNTLINKHLEEFPDAANRLRR